MNLIDLYVSEVGRDLPSKTREDIEREIRSLIEDMLEDEAKAQGRQPDEQMVYDVLKKMGSPEKVAASYLPPRYLIGPKYFPTFWMVTRIVMTVILIVGAVGWGVNLGQAKFTGLDFASGFGGIISSMIAAFGNIVLVFAILQWLKPEPNFDPQKEWDPRTLKAEPDPERVKPAEQIGGIVGSIFLLLLLNVYPQWLGIFNYANGEWLHVRVLTDTFMSYIPWMSLILVAEIALSAYLLQQGRWTTNMRWIWVAIHIGNIALLGMLLSGPALAAFNPEDLARVGWVDFGAQSIESVNNALNLGLRIALGIALAMQVIEVGKMFLRLLGHRVSLPADLTR